MTVRTDDTGFGGLVILQDPDAFCYGVDAVLLAGFAAERAKNAKRIMDLGTGNGIVPLILAHKTKAPVLMGMDIQPGSLELARETAGINGLTDRLSFMECDVTDIPAELKGTFDAARYAQEQQRVRDLLAAKSAEADGAYLKRYIDAWTALQTAECGIM